jgi:hypothetical protein
MCARGVSAAARASSGAQRRSPSWPMVYSQRWRNFSSCSPPSAAATSRHSAPSCASAPRASAHLDSSAASESARAGLRQHAEARGSAAESDPWRRLRQTARPAARNLRCARRARSSAPPTGCARASAARRPWPSSRRGTRHPQSRPPSWRRCKLECRLRFLRRALARPRLRSLARAARRRREAPPHTPRSLRPARRLRQPRR